MEEPYVSRPTPWMNRGGLRRDQEFNLAPEKTALLIIDMQYLDAHPDYGIGIDARERGVFEEHYAYYFRKVAEMLPRLQRLLSFCRERCYEVIHVRIASLTPDCRDVSLGYKRLGLLAPPGSKEAEILRELQPLPGEIVLSKSSSSVFNSTAVDQILRNLGKETLIFVGVGTNYCVETSVRDAADRSYSVYLLSDGCAAKTPENQRFALQILDGVYCKVKSVKDILDLMERSSSGA
jgi:nicotinamidase-related amidase